MASCSPLARWTTSFARSGPDTATHSPSAPTSRARNRLIFTISDEALVPSTVAALVRDDIPVLEVIPKRPTIEQLYFATLDEEDNT